MENQITMRIIPLVIFACAIGFMFVAIVIGGWIVTARLKAKRPLEERMANMEAIILDQEKRNVLFAKPD